MISPRARVWGALLVGALCVLAAGCSSSDDSSTAADLTPVSLTLDWYPNANHAGIFSAVGEGYFAREGLSVAPTVPSDAAAALKEVGTGTTQFAISYEPDVILARSQGIPVVAVGALIAHPLNSIIVRADSGIENPRQLEGTTVGMTGLPLERPLLDTVVRDAGGDPARVRTKNVGFNLSPALAADRVDAIIGAYWNIESVDLESQGIATRAFRLEEHGVPNYNELVVVTSDRLAADRPELVRSFLAALRRGQDWAATDQAGARTHLMDANPDLDSDALKRQLALTADLLSPPDGETLAMQPAEWTAFIAWMTRNGLIERPVKVDAVMSTAFLPPARD